MAHESVLPPARHSRAGAGVNAVPASPRLLFVPVSGPTGMGEYFQSLAIAQAARQRWPDAPIHFLLNRNAPYAPNTPFEATLLPSSPTFHTPEVVAAIATFRPDVVVFANAGRTAQFRAARAVGAAVVFISYRRRKRLKAARWRWMRLIDEHWIAFPRFISGGPVPFERFNRWLCGKPAPRYLDIVLPPLEAGHDAPPAGGAAAGTGQVLVVPGGGAAPPNAPDAPARFRAAAVLLAEAGVPTVYVGPGEGPQPQGLRTHRFLPQHELFALMRSAHLVVTNGGQTLLQAVACGVPCVAAPINRDQPIRVRRSAQAGVAVPARLDALDIAATARSVIADEPRRQAMIAHIAALSLADGAQVAVEALAGLFNRQRHAAP
ncbi:MAG: glycosyltransferase [Steroidobacteraceae bacterium]